jgi:serine/threonine-protein kinase
VAHAAKQNLVDKMRAEAMVLCQIKHDNLVEVYDAGIAQVGGGDRIWMAMELLDGESLRERIVREGALRPSLALNWAAQVADGLQAAHDAQVVHRDLKPDNIFITKKGDIKVLDFGTAKFETMGGAPTTQHNDRMGTVPYMSPEQLGGEPLDGRSDIFALGFILYEMLAGRHPFTGPDGAFPPLDQLLPMMLAGEPASLASHVGPAVWQVVAGAMASDKNQRYGTMRELASALRQVRGQLTGTGVAGPLRLSGDSGLYPPTGPLPGQSGAHAAMGISNATPPPVGMSGVQPVPKGGVTLPALISMAVAAAAVGALVVVLAFRGNATDDDEPAPIDVSPAASSVEPEPSESEAEAAPQPNASAAPSASASAELAASASATPTVKPAAAPTSRPVVRPRPGPKPKPAGEIF